MAFSIEPAIISLFCSAIIFINDRRVHYDIWIQPALYILFFNSSNTIVDLHCSEAVIYAPCEEPVLSSAGGCWAPEHRESKLDPS